MVLLLFFILMAVGVQEGLAFSCGGNSENSNCTCAKQPPSFRLECQESPNSEQMLTAEYHPGYTFQIQCKAPHIDFGVLKGFEIGPVKYFALKFCPLPEITFKELMQSLQISQVTQIDFKYSELGDSLFPNLLEGLETVTQISFNNNGLTSLPENLFDGVPKVTSINLMENQLKTIPRYTFSRTPELQILELGKNKLVSLEPGVFKNLSHLRLLNLWGNQLANLTRSIFVDVQNLESLDLQVNGLKTLPPDIFADLSKLASLNLNHNDFTHLPYGLFMGTPSLDRLRLNYNRKTIRTLPDRFLSNLPRLKDVGISRCNISTLPEDLFWNSPNIEIVSFEGNQLTELPKDLFRDAKQLRIIDLQNNKLESLPDLLFSSTSKLRVAKFSNNNLHKISGLTFSGLSQLKTLELEYNKLNDIDIEAFSSLTSLTEIKLSNNDLTFQDTFYSLYGATSSPLQYCHKLEIVLLANNKIEHIFEDWKNLLSSLRILDLSQNKIKFITAGDLSFLSQDLTVNLSNNEIERVDLRNIELLAQEQLGNTTGVNYSDKRKTNILIKNNPIICDCFIYDLIRYFEGHTPEVRFLFKIEIGETQCAGPPNVQYMKVTEMYSKGLACSLNQLANVSNPCPSNCKCSYKVHSNTIIMDCSDGNLTQIPRNIPSVGGTQKTELYMRNNKLTKLPSDNIFIEHNFTTIDVSDNQITDVEGVLFSESLKVLRLHNNNITVLSNKILDHWGHLNLSELTLYGNHWKCECETQFLSDFIRNNWRKIPSYGNITCWPDRTRSIQKLSVSDLCLQTEDFIIIGCVIIAILGVLTGLTAAMYYRYQMEIKVWLFAHGICLWLVTEEELDKDKKYDAFVSYSVLDKEFVEKILVTELESGPKPFKLCLHYRDWEPGGWIHNQIIKSVDDSRRTLIVLSRNFLDSDWSRLEFQAAHKQALSEGRARIIIILYGDIGPRDNLDPELRTYLSTNTYVEWGDPWFWKKLKYALPHPPELRKRIPGELRDRNIRRYEQAEKLDLVRKSNHSLNIESTPPANCVMTNPLNALNGTKEYTTNQYDIMAQTA